MTEIKYYAVDFDGTLFEESVHTYPIPGPPKMDIINTCKLLQDKGHKIILWTAREGDNLERAIQEAAKFGLTFDLINENVPERAQRWGDSRKVVPDYYVDDRCLSLNEFQTFARIERDLNGKNNTI